MKRVVLFTAIAIILLLISLIAVLAFNNDVQKPFYVGVTFGGDNITDAKLLVDKVKNYTNLFVLQSGVLQRDANAMIEIGDYATSSGLHFLVYFGMDEAYRTNEWLEWFEAAKQRWGSQFLGIYYGDESGGKMLDAYVNLGKGALGQETTTIAGKNVPIYTKGLEQITKMAGGGVSIYTNFSDISYFPDGKILVSKWDISDPAETDGFIQLIGNITTYYPNGTITFFDRNGDFYTPENGSSLISQVELYEDILRMHPFQSYDDIAETFVTLTQSKLEWLSNTSITVLTSDYALYWWDYQSGYDVLLAQFGWNHTTAQDIALVRGAANLHDKSWGAIITWKYTETEGRYLASGEEIYDQMRMAYECGAEYVVIFNYAPNMTGPYGTLQPEHFDALERFWNDVVQNPAVVHGGIKADSVLVLPRNYGWGMRHSDDTIWGLWGPDEKSPQVWTQLQNSLKAHGLCLDIVYEDPQYPVAGKYRQIYYWNQTG
jgi:hypothetical protein